MGRDDPAAIPEDVQERADQMPVPCPIKAKLPAARIVDDIVRAFFHPEVRHGPSELLNSYDPVGFPFIPAIGCPKEHEPLDPL